MSSALVDTIAATGILLMIAFELRSESFRRTTFRDRRRLFRNLAYLAASLLTMVALNRISSGVGRVLPALADWEQYKAANLIGCFLFAELYAYLVHRAMHAHPLLWRLHFQHHVETEYNLWMTAHTHAIQVIVSGVILAALLKLAGFSITSVQIYFLFYGFVNTYQHSALDWSLGPLDRFIVGPAYHRRHHAIGSDGNFGDTLTFWDVVLRTVIGPKTARVDGERYGLEPGGREPYGFFAELLHIFQRRGAY